jgi:molecular chaperone GrpE
LAEPPDDEGRSPTAEPPPADASDTAEAGIAAAEPTTAAPAAAPVNPSEQRARLAEDRLAEVMAAYRTLKQENEDVRERQSRNLERRFDQRRERLLLKFIDVLDNLDRGLEAAQTSYAGQPLLEGMILVRTQLLQTLQDEGLDRIPVVGLPFDPAVSESVGTVPVKEAEQHHVVMKELLRGYRLNGRIARPSRVMIGLYDAPAEAVSAAAEAVPAESAEGSDSAATPLEIEPAQPDSVGATMPEEGREPSTDETAQIPAMLTPPPLPPKIPSPRRKGGR